MVGVVLSNVVAMVPARAQSGTGLQISPVRGDVVVESGSQGSVTIKVTNTVPAQIRAEAEVVDFEPEENGQVKLLEDGANPATSIKDLIGAIEPKVLGAGESFDAVVPVNVPASQAPGTYYGVIRFNAFSTDGSTSGTTAVTLGASVGYVLIVEVPGNLTELMSIERVLPERNGSQSRLLTANPQFVNVTVKNNGQTLLKPFGAVQIFNFRNKEVATLGVNGDDIKTNVLPQNRRVLKADIKDTKLLPGRYKAVTTMTYGRAGETIDYTTTFWILPPIFVIAVAVALVLLFVFIGLAIRKLKVKTTRHRR